MSRGDASADRDFVHLLEWIIEHNGGTQGLEKRVSSETLRKWRGGDYPRARSSRTVSAAEEWARDRFGDDYPPHWAPAGGLVALAGPRRRGDDGSGRTREGSDAPSGEAADSSPPALLSPRTPPAVEDHVAQPDRRHLPRILVLLSVALVLVAVGVVALVLADRPTTSGASVLYARDGAAVPLRECPRTSCSAQRLQTGTKVRMICWRDAERVDLNYSSDRWFNVEVASSGDSGWVHSSQVSGQTRVGLC